MPKRTSSLANTDLNLAILKQIPRQRSITAEDIHNNLRNDGIERNIRSIQRHLAMLTEEGLIQNVGESKPYEYQRLGKINLDFDGLTPKESLLLHLAHQHLQNLLPARLMQSLQTLMSEASQTIENSQKAILEREWVEKIRVVETTQPLIPPTIDDAVFDTVTTALYENKQLTLHYRNASGEEKTKDVYPLGLAQQGTRLYLVCRFPPHKNERSVAMHRILHAKASTLSFERPKEFNLAKYDEDGRFLFGEGNKATLSFTITRVAGQHLLESTLSTDQVVEDLDDDYYRITATVVDSGMLKSWLRSFGDDVTDVSIQPLKP